MSVSTGNLYKRREDVVLAIQRAIKVAQKAEAQSTWDTANAEASRFREVEALLRQAQRVAADSSGRDRRRRSRRR